VVPATTTTTVQDYRAMLVDVLSDPDFSATFILRGTSTTESGSEIEMTGAGAISGLDSELWMVSDFSGLDRVLFARGGARGAVGPGATTATSLASKVISGILYQQDTGGHWHESASVDVNTTPGHVLSVLSQAQSFEVTGSETMDGIEYVVLSPTAPLVYDPFFFSVDPSAVESFDSDTSVLVDDDGNPVRITVQIEAVFTNAQDSTWTNRYDLSDFGSVKSVDPPLETWVAASSQGFTTLDAELDLIDFEVPSSWEISPSEDGSLWAFTPEGTIAGFVTVPVDQGADGEQLLREAADAAGIQTTDITDSDLGLFSSLLGTGTTEIGFGMVYSEVFFDRLLFAAFWAGPSGDTDLQAADFREVLRTLHLREGNGGGVVPGLSPSGPELQTDTLNLLTPVATVASGSDCETADVLWTELAHGVGPNWTEDWYVDACGDLQMHEIDFVESSDGGTDILMTNQPLHLAESNAAYLDEELDKDSHLAASRLADQPWAFDPSLGVDEIDVATAVTEARFQGSRLCVLIVANPLGDAFFDFADSVVDELGGGTLLLIDPGYVGWSSLGDIYTKAELDQALDAALDGSSNEEIIQRFVSALNTDD
jgi:hypothetical protein